MGMGGRYRWRGVRREIGQASVMLGFGDRRGRARSLVLGGRGLTSEESGQGEMWVWTPGSGMLRRRGLSVECGHGSGD